MNEKLKNEYLCLYISNICPTFGSYCYRNRRTLIVGALGNTAQATHHEFLGPTSFDINDYFSAIMTQWFMTVGPP